MTDLIRQRVAALEELVRQKRDELICAQTALDELRWALAQLDEPRPNGLWVARVDPPPKPKVKAIRTGTTASVLAFMRQKGRPVTAAEVTQAVGHGVSSTLDRLKKLGDLIHDRESHVWTLPSDHRLLDESIEGELILTQRRLRSSRGELTDG